MTDEERESLEAEAKCLRSHLVSLSFKRKLLKARFDALGEEYLSFFKRLDSIERRLIQPKIVTNTNKIPCKCSAQSRPLTVTQAMDVLGKLSVAELSELLVAVTNGEL